MGFYILPVKSSSGKGGIYRLSHFIGLLSDNFKGQNNRIIQYRKGLGFKWQGPCCLV